MSVATKTEKRALIAAFKTEAGCADCGYREHPAALQFDHPEGGARKLGYLGGTAFAINWSWEHILTEIQKCVVRCANCHAIRTAEAGYSGGYHDHKVRRGQSALADHGTRARYGAGCRCEPCRAANAEYFRLRRASV